MAAKLFSLLYPFAIILAILSLNNKHVKSDQYIRDRVVKIFSGGAICTGEQIRTASGRDFILTAAHCLSPGDQSVDVIPEGRSRITVKVLALDHKCDLMLLEAVPGLSGLTIAQEIHAHEHLRSFGHGGAMDTYKTEGEFIMSKPVESPDPLMGMTPSVYATTVKIIPGSSGGPVLNDNGELAGVSDMTNPDTDIGYLVSLESIHSFLGDY